MPHSAQNTENTEINAFVALGLDQLLAQQLSSQNITAPTAVQALAIPELLAGHDLMVSAQTGTGKTAAFLLPALQRLLKNPNTAGRGPRLLVLTPTRELAEQVAKVATEFCRRIPKCKVASFVGGVPYPVQNKLLSQPLEVMVATPGRLNDLIRGGRVDFRRLEMLVLDEADRMLDMGFIDEVETIVASLPKDRQTALFSATLSESVQSFAAPMLRAPKLIELAAQNNSQAQIDQSVHYADGYEHKLKIAAQILKTSAEGEQSIVFTATKADADGVAEWLKLEGFRAAAMHGDLPQRDRRRTLDRLRRGEADILVATDVAARGIDVAGIGLVINFDLPKFAEDYIHRIGRTGRAGRSGRAISLVGKNDFQPMTRIKRVYKIEFETMALPGLEANFRPERMDRRPGTGGKRPHGGGGGYKGKRPHGEGFNRDHREFRSDAPRERSFNRDGDTRSADRRPAEPRAERPFGNSPYGDRQARSPQGGRDFNRDSAPRTFRNEAAPRQGEGRSFRSEGTGARKEGFRADAPRGNADRGNRRGNRYE